MSPTELAKPAAEREYVKDPLPYNDASYRQSSTPILWLDHYGDVRWNEAAERGMINYLTEKQYPNLDRIDNSSLNKELLLKTCRGQSIFLLHQHWSGFFSRVLCFIAQFGQTLYSPRIGVLRGTRFSGDRGSNDDFLALGVIRYFLPMSICSAYVHHPDMNDLKNLVEIAPNAITMATTQHLRENAASRDERPFISNEFWKMDYHHVPIRKRLFDRKKSDVPYGASVQILTDHSEEHIYAPNNEKNVSLGGWIDTNKPDAFSSDLMLDRLTHPLTWQDYVFGSFLRYMFVLFFGSRNAPRIEMSVRVLTTYWSSYLIDKHLLPPKSDVFKNLAGVYIRRGDKSNEDSFWYKHQHWRNLSYYVKGIVDEEKRRKEQFKYVFIMTDDTAVMRSFKDYADSSSKGTDEPYAREHLRGRDILYNVLAPQDCFDPFRRIGFDQFLVSMRFLIEHAAYTVGHTDSNVFRFFREVVYAQRQQQPNVQSFTFVRNAPDSFDSKTEIPKIFN